MRRFLEYFVFPWVMPFYGGGKGGGGGGTRIDDRIVDMAQKGTFKPFTITTSGGTAFGREGEFGATASPEFQQIQQQALTGANQLLPSIAGALGREVTPFEFQTDADRLTQDYFNQQQALLQPAFEQQRQQLQSDLFGSGRMGLSLAGSAVGASGEGMVNPDAFGLARAQSQTLGELAAQSRQQALGDASARYALESGMYGINQAAEQQRAQNLLAGATGLFGLGTGVSDIELALLQGGLAGEQLRGASYSDAARALAAGQVQEQDSGGKGLLGSVVGAAGNIGASYVTGGLTGGLTSGLTGSTISQWAKNNPSAASVLLNQ